MRYKMNQNKQNKPAIKLPRLTLIFIGILIFSIIVYIISTISPAFADFFNFDSNSVSA